MGMWILRHSPKRHDPNISMNSVAYVRHQYIDYVVSFDHCVLLVDLSSRKPRRYTRVVRWTGHQYWVSSLIRAWHV